MLDFDRTTTPTSTGIHSSKNTKQKTVNEINLANSIANSDNNNKEETQTHGNENINNNNKTNQTMEHELSQSDNVNKPYVNRKLTDFKDEN